MFDFTEVNFHSVDPQLAPFPVHSVSTHQQHTLSSSDFNLFHKKTPFTLPNSSPAKRLPCSLSLSVSVTPPAVLLCRFLDFVSFLVIFLFLFLLCCFDLLGRLSHGGKLV